MSEQANQPEAAKSAKAATESLRMPTRGELVEQALSRFETVKTRSSVLTALSRPDLVDVGVWLTEPGKTIMDAWRLLNDALGKDEHDPAIPRTNFYRYSEAFLDVYAQVEAEHRRWITRLRVTDATDADTRDMTRLGRSRFVELVTEALVTSDHIADLGTDAAKIAAVLADAERAQHNQDKLELERQNLERQIRETASRLETAEQRSRLLEQRIDERVKALQTKIDELSKAAQRGQSIPQSIFDSIREELTGLRTPGTSGTSGGGAA